jgi:Cu2+-exporting ATPase
MSCCSVIAPLEPEPSDLPDPSAWVRDAGAGKLHLDLLVPGIHCAGCIARIEKALNSMPGVTRARVNMSTRRVGVDWRAGKADPADLVKRVAALGYRVQPFDAAMLGAGDDDAAGRELLRSLAVAGFAAANIMLLSVSVWSGAQGPTRDLFHAISALIAIPAIAYAGRPFFRSAFAALKGGGLNMDVPISLAVLLAAGTSLYETLSHGQHAYFDAAVTLLFFLLIGRYLDHRLRARARSAVAELMALSASGATLIEADGGRRYVPLSRVKPGMTVAVAAGERAPVDAVVVKGRSDLDRSLVTGETLPEPAGPGAAVYAGSLNLSGPLELKVQAAGADTFLAEAIRLMEEAERGKARYVALADRIARIYAPGVHLLAAATFFGWLWATGGDIRAAILAATAVLIITCPCALGLAVPVVQVVASGLLFRSGIMVKDGAAIEKLAGIDTVVFDKTGTLTRGRPALVDAGSADGEAMALAAGLARESRHPLSRALAQAAEKHGIQALEAGQIREAPGEGLEGIHAGKRVRLGRAEWCGAEETGEARAAGLTELWLSAGDAPAIRFRFRDEIRADAAATVAALKAAGLEVELLSGDTQAAVRSVADSLGIARFTAAARPADKVARLEQLRAEGRKVLMVGDGINDAPALAAAHVSMSPGTAADVSRTAASFVFLNDRLASICNSFALARRANRAVRQNFALAFAYNLIAVPLAVAGLASPLIAALAMSSSSLTVTLNALRLRIGMFAAHGQAAPAPAAADDATVALRPAA